MNERFWIIWNPLSYKPPTVKFKSKAEAEEIARDMAKRHGEPFYVCEAQSLSESVATTTRLIS